MKPFFASVLFFFATATCFAQFNKAAVIRSTASFILPVNGLGTNEAGFGLGLDASFFSKNRLQALLETNADVFIGDKLLVVDPSTNQPSKGAVVYSIRIGPHYFLADHLALAITYGPSWSRFRSSAFSVDDGFRYSLTGFWGRQQRLVTKLFYVHVPAGEGALRYFALAAGYRF